MEEWEKTGIIISLSRINGFSPQKRFSFLATAAVFVPRDRENINIFVGGSEYDRYKKP
jgi:hypothetical protein